MWAVKKILFPVDSLSCVTLTPYMHKAEQVFGEAPEAEYGDVFILGRTSATIGPFELAQSHLLACARFAVVGFEHLTSMSQTLPLRNLNHQAIKRTAS